MLYSDIVKNHLTDFSACGFLDYAFGLAHLLDADAFAIPPKEGRDWKTKEHAKERENVFTKFCAICVRAGVDVPDLESEFFEVVLDDGMGLSMRSEKGGKKEKAMMDHVWSQIKDESEEIKNVCSSILCVLDLFSGSGFSRFSEEKFIAKLNLVLTNAGLKPIRPQYTDVSIAAPRLIASLREINLLIVDDDPGAALRTAQSLVGVTGLSIDFFHQKGGDGFTKLKGMDLQDLLEKTAQDVLSQNPDVVLMDRGLNDIYGEDLIKKIKEMCETPPIFVGNTDGDSKPLDNAGALKNCQKGKVLDGVEWAICTLNQ